MILSTLIYILEIIAVLIVITTMICLLIFIIGGVVKAVHWLADVIADTDEPQLLSSDDWLE